MKHRFFQLLSIYWRMWPECAAELEREFTASDHKLERLFVVWFGWLLRPIVSIAAAFDEFRNGLPQ